MDTIIISDLDDERVGLLTLISGLKRILNEILKDREAADFTYKLERNYYYLKDIGDTHSREVLAAFDYDGVLKAYQAARKMYIRLCRVCGCSEWIGCQKGCYWVEDDLCSRCSENENLPDETG